MPDPKPFTWDQAARRFRDGSGKFLPVKTVRDGIDRLAKGAGDEIRAVSERLQTGAINASQWAIEVRALIKASQIAAATIALGGRAGLDARGMAATANLIKQQYAYLYQFSREIEGGLPLDGKFLARSAMYGQAARSTYENIGRARDIEAGYDQERRRIGGKRPCMGCLREAAKGWRPAGELLPIGGCQCLSRCACYVQRKKSSPPTSTPSPLPTSVGGKFPPVPFALSDKQRARRSRIVMADVAKLDASLAADPGGFYVGRGGSGESASKSKYAGAKAFIGKAATQGATGTAGETAGQSVNPPDVSLGPDGRAYLDDGRHRFAVLRDAGVTAVPVAVAGGQVKAFEKLYGVGVPKGRGVTMSDTDGNPTTSDDLATFKGGGGKSGGPGKGSGKGGASGGGSGKLSGGRWATVHGHPIYIKEGKIVAGGKPGLTHDKDSKHPLGPVKPTAHQPIPMRPKPGGLTDSSQAHGHAKGPDHERARDEKKSQADYRKAGEAHAKAKSDHSAAKKALADHDKAVKGGRAKLDGLQAKHEAGAAKIAEHKAAIAGHDAKIAELKEKLKGKIKASKGKDDKGKASNAGPVKPAPAGESHTAGKVAHDKSDGSYHVPHGTTGPSGSPSKIQPRPASGDIIRSSTPRDARESSIHAQAKASGKSAMVVTSTPQYHSGKVAGHTQHRVGGRHVASHSVNAEGKFVTTLHHRDGTQTVKTHDTKESAKAHLEAYVKHRITKGTTKHAVVGSDLSKFDHAKHGIGGAYHKVTGRVLGDGGQAKFDDATDDLEIDMGDGVVMFKGGGGAKSAPASTPGPVAHGQQTGTAGATKGKSTGTAKGHASTGKPGGCGTGAGGFKAGNTCGHKGNRNAKVEDARAAHTQAKSEVLAHLKAHKAARRAAAKAGGTGPVAPPKELHAALKKSAAAHVALRDARATHKAEQRDRRNTAAKERRAVNAGKAQPLTAKPAEAAKPAHTILSSSQARPAPTDKGLPHERLAVAAARHRMKARDLRRQASDHHDQADAGRSITHQSIPKVAHADGGGRAGRSRSSSVGALRGPALAERSAEGKALGLRAAMLKRRADVHEKKATKLEGLDKRGAVGPAKAKEAEMLASQAVKPTAGAAGAGGVRPVPVSRAVEPVKVATAQKSHKDIMRDAKKAARASDKAMVADIHNTSKTEAGREHLANSQARAKQLGGAEPHTLTRDEFAKRYGGADKPGPRRDEAIREHDAWVKQAIQHGRPVASKPTAGAGARPVPAAVAKPEPSKPPKSHAAADRLERIKAKIAKRNEAMANSPEARAHNEKFNAYRAARAKLGSATGKDKKVAQKEYEEASKHYEASLAARNASSGSRDLEYNMMKAAGSKYLRQSATGDIAPASVGAHRAAHPYARTAADRKTQADHISAIHRAPAEHKVAYNKAQEHLDAVQKELKGSKSLLNASNQQLLDYSRNARSTSPKSFENNALRLYQARTAINSTAKSHQEAKAKSDAVRSAIAKRVRSSRQA